MVVLLGKGSLLPCDRLTVQIGQSKEQRRIQLRTTFSFDDGEAGTLWVKLERDGLEQDRVMDLPIGTRPIEQPVSDHQLHRFALAVYSPPKLIELFKYLHSFPGRPLVRRPRCPRCTPLPEGSNTLRRIFKCNDDCLPLCIRLVPRLPHSQFSKRVIPVPLKPPRQQVGVGWGVSQPRPINLQEVR